MSKRILFGLFVALTALSGLWVTYPTGIGAQQDCNANDTGAALAPEKPDLAMAFREATGQTSEGPKNIRLRWLNKASNLGCTGVEANYSPEGTAELGGTWDLLDTMLDPAASEYLHVGVPDLGDICYRVYAANALGRSEYSNRVCIDLSGSSTGSDNPDNQADGVSSRGDSGSRVLIMVVAVAAIAVAGGGVAMWRSRTKRAG